MSPTSSPARPVVAVTGASGGLGASTLSAATALAVPGPVTAVDGPGAGGLDVTLGVEHVDGLRWDDLLAHEGAVVARELRARLPAREVPVLSARRAGPPQEAMREVVRGLAGEAPVILDLPRRALTAPVWLDLADVVVLVVGLRPRWLRDAEALVAGLGDATDRTVVVTRGAHRTGPVPDRVAGHLGLALLEHLPDDPSVVRAEARGRPPGRRGRTAEVARAVVEVARLDDRLLLGLDEGVGRRAGSLPDVGPPTPTRRSRRAAA